MKAGRVYLVGAGPGDPGLITLKGMECLARADVIVYDHLLDDKLLKMTPPSSEKIYVGKSASSHVMEQKEINRLLIEKAREGKTVIRLKGGDPFVLGRGGEEAEALAAERIPFEVVPGVSSAIAVPAYAGIPVTHRKLASSFAVITGHEDPHKADSGIDWEKLATSVDTLVFLMGMQNLSTIMNKLVRHGRPLDTPVAVVKNGTRPEQQTVTGSLKNIAARVKERGLGPPAVVVVGKVVGLREKLRWFDNRPLSGKRILVTRSRHQAGALSGLLAERGAQPVELPAIDIRKVADTSGLDRAILLDLPRYQWLVFTSVNGVEAFFEGLHRLKLDSRAVHGLRVAAIGPATAKSLEQYGITADYLPAVYTGEGLVSGFKSLHVAGQKFMLLRADIAGKELADGLSRLGAEVHEVTAYKTLPAKKALAKARELLAAGGIDVITFTSSSTVSNLVAAPGKLMLPENVKIACIGPKTAAAAAAAGFKVDILAREHTIPGLVAAMEEYFGKEA